MARSEARIAVAIWSDPDFLALDQGAQRLFMFLLSQPDLAHDGVIALRERRWSKAAAGLTAADVADDLTKLEKARFVVIDEDAEELLVRSFIRRDRVYRQPNVLRAAADHLKGITSQIILGELGAELDRIVAADDIPAASLGILAEMRATTRATSERIDERSEIVPPCETPLVDHAESGQASPRVTDPDETAAPEGSGNPSREGTANPTPGAPGERGVVTAATTASPFPVPRASDPRPRPPAGGRAGVRANAGAGTREAPPPETCPDHEDHPDPPPCGRCAGARKAHARWLTAEAERRRNAPRCRFHRGQPAHNCALCRAEALAAPEDS